MVTKNLGVEETRRLLEDRDEEVGDGRGDGEDEDNADEEESARDVTHLAVVQRETDGDVALHSHASQDERGGARGEDRCHDLRMGEEGGGRAQRLTMVYSGYFVDHRVIFSFTTCCGF